MTEVMFPMDNGFRTEIEAIGGEVMFSNFFHWNERW